MSSSKIAIAIMISSGRISKMKFFSSEVIPSEKICFNSISPQKVHVELLVINFNFGGGYGTTHKVNNLILQGSFENIESRHKSSSRKKKKFRGSFLPIVLGTCLQYCQKKRLGPSVLTFPENEASEFILDEANKRHFLWSLMRVCLFFFLFSIHYFASILKNLQ